MSNHHSVDFKTIGMPDILLNYLSGNKKLSARFNGDPFDQESFSKLAKVVGKRKYPREDLVRRLVDYNQELGAGEASLHRIDLLKKPNTFVIFTGQQPSVLTGPLFTIYKAISAINLARRLSTQFKDPYLRPDLLVRERRPRPGRNEPR